MKKKLEKKLKIGLALGGGGARGFAHLGVIKCFEENGIVFDYIAGTSVGSLVGAFYANGCTSSEMIEIASKLQPKDIKKNIIPFVPDKTDGIEAIIKKNISVRNVEDLKIPLSIVAVNMKTGEEVDITKGELSKAVAGSCAVPSVFSTVEFEGMNLNDGGLTNTIPSDVLRKHGCDIVIAVDVNPTRGYGTDSTKLLDILSASIRIMMKVNAIKGEIYSDCLIAPNLKKFSAMTMDGYKEMIEIGYQTAKLKIDEIKALINPENPLTFWGKIKLFFTGNKNEKHKQVKNYEKNHKIK